MEGKKIHITREGRDQLEAELEDLKVNKRKEVADELKEARAQGDLSENAEYDAAKLHKQQIEDRISEIEGLLKNAEIFDEDAINPDEINIGSRIKILDVEANEELEYTIVGSTEANSLKGRISNESPVGKALQGHRAGDTVKVETQVGILSFKVLEVNKKG